MKIAIGDKLGQYMIICNSPEIAGIYGGLSALMEMKKRGLFPEEPKSDKAFAEIDKAVKLIQKALEIEDGSDKVSNAVPTSISKYKHV